MDLLAAPPTIGVELGARAIKIAAVRRGRGGRPHLLSAAVHAAPAGAIEDGAVLDPAAAAAALREALRRAGLRRGRAVIGIGGRGVVVRNLTFPPMPADELRSAVRWEAERQLPVKIDDMVLDSQVLREIVDEGQRRVEVLMAAVPERDALAYHAVVRDAGLDVAAIEVTPLALWRIFGDDDRVTAAADIGPDDTEIVIVAQGLPLVCRTVPAGIPAGPAGPASAEPPVPGAESGAVATGIAQSIDYFEAQTHRRVERVVLAGDGALVAGVVRTVTGALGAPVEIGNPLRRFPAAPGVPDAARLAVAAGLALRAVA